MNDGLSIEEALERADWLTRYARDRLPDSPRRFSRGLLGHVDAMVTQSRAVMVLLDPQHDEPKEQVA